MCMSYKEVLTFPQVTTRMRHMAGFGAERCLAHPRANRKRIACRTREPQ